MSGLPLTGPLLLSRQLLMWLPATVCIVYFSCTDASYEQSVSVEGDLHCIQLYSAPMVAVNVTLQARGQSLLIFLAKISSQKLSWTYKALTPPASSGCRVRLPATQLSMQKSYLKFAARLDFCVVGFTPIVESFSEAFFQSCKQVVYVGIPSAYITNGTTATKTFSTGPITLYGIGVSGANIAGHHKVISECGSSHT